MRAWRCCCTTTTALARAAANPSGRSTPGCTRRGIRAPAIKCASSIDGAEADRIALWGGGLSGGVALTVAGIEDRVAAVVVQVPAIGYALAPCDPTGSLYRAIRETIVSGIVEPAETDVEGPMPVVSDDQVPPPISPSAVDRVPMVYRIRRTNGHRVGK